MFHLLGGTRLLIQMLQRQGSDCAAAGDGKVDYLGRVEI